MDMARTTIDDNKLFLLDDGLFVSMGVRFCDVKAEPYEHLQGHLRHQTHLAQHDGDGS